MAFRYADDFGGYDSAGNRTALDPNYDYSPQIGTSEAGLGTPGRVDGRYAHVTSSDLTTGTNQVMQLPLGGLIDSDTVTIGIAYRNLYPEFLRAISGSSSQAHFSILAQFIDFDTVGMVTVYARAGTIIVKRGGTEGTLLGVAKVSIVSNIWYFIEIKIKFNSSTGTVDIRVHERNVLSLSGVNTQPTAVTTPSTVRMAGSYDHLGSDGGVSRAEIDTLYILDGVDGTTLSPAQIAANNTFLGDVGGKRIDADGDGSTTDFTTSTGTTHYTLIDEDPNNGDTDYVESDTVNDIDLYTFGALPKTPAQIEALVAKSWARKTDTGSRDMAHRVLSNASTQDITTDYAPSTDYTLLSSIFTVDPNTSGRWSESSANAVELGPKVLT